MLMKTVGVSQNNTAAGRKTQISNVFCELVSYPEWKLKKK